MNSKSIIYKIHNLAASLIVSLVSSLVQPNFKLLQGVEWKLFKIHYFQFRVWRQKLALKTRVYKEFSSFSKTQKSVRVSGKFKPF